jgi:N-acetyl sugar amidotransferase
MTLRSYKQCTRCVMDTSDPEITFDKNGYCNHCSDYLEVRARHRYQGKKSDLALERLMSTIRSAGRSRRYDCIVGMSGGVDSSYAAYLIKQRGLRALAVHMDNGWDSEHAVTNIKKITDTLGVDYESYVLDWNEFKDLQLAFLKASVPEAETPTDVAIPVALHHFAAKYNIKYIINAGNIATEGILPKSWHYNARDLKYFRYIRRNFGRSQSRNFRNFGFKNELYFKMVKRIKVVYPLNFVRFEQDEVLAILSDKFGYKYGGQKHFESRYTKFIHAYYLYEKFRIDYRRATFSSLICNNQMDRESAIVQLRTKPCDDTWVTEEKYYISKKLGISTNELEQILALPPKWYWDYPNDDTKLGYVYGAYRWLFKKEKLASV